MIPEQVSDTVIPEQVSDTVIHEKNAEPSDTVIQMIHEKKNIGSSVRVDRVKAFDCVGSGNTGLPAPAAATGQFWTPQRKVCRGCADTLITTGVQRHRDTSGQ